MKMIFREEQKDISAYNIKQAILKERGHVKYVYKEQRALIYNNPWIQHEVCVVQTEGEDWYRENVKQLC